MPGLPVRCVCIADWLALQLPSERTCFVCVFASLRETAVPKFTCELEQWRGSNSFAEMVTAMRGNHL